MYTAPTDEALVYDLKKTKDFGYNMVRKHVKVEPARWYTHCDQLGLIVWQDMPNGGPSPQWQARNYFNGREVIRSAASEANYRKEWKEIIDCLLVSAALSDGITKGPTKVDKKICLLFIKISFK